MAEPKFEDALKKLEAIAESLEGGELKLDDCSVVRHHAGSESGDAGLGGFASPRMEG